MQNKSPRPPCFVLVLDVTMSREELQDAKDSLGQLVALLPEECFVALVTFGSTVTIHELCETSHGMSKAFVLRGNDDVEQDKLKKLLGLELTPEEHAYYAQNKQRGSHVAEEAGAMKRFVLPVSECEFQLQTVLDELSPDPSPTEKGTRPCRCTGVAIAAAQALVAESHSAQGARVMVFTSGPCTLGPGTIVGRDMSENIRTHQDFAKSNAKYWKQANNYYNSLGVRLATHAHTLDVFACSLDQVGLAEMKTAVDQTGGVMVLAEQFRAESFRQSLKRMFRRDENGMLDMYFNGTFSVFCVPQVMVQGAIGPVSALAVKSRSISENEVGLGQTTSWRCCAMNQSTSLAVYYEIINQHANPIPAGTPFYLQFCTRFKLSDGEIRLRVMTVARRWAESSAAHDIVQGFDQEATATLMARQATFRVEHEEEFDLLRWLDRTLIRVGSKFGEYAKDAPETFRMPGPFAIYPQFMFNLRRSQFLQTANNSPDETAFYRLMMGRETVLNSLVMIQPTLMSYTFNGPPTPVLLDVASITPDSILLLDTFFMIVVHAGATIAAWRKANYQDQPEHEAFRELLAKPVADAAAAMAIRCPTPRLVECDQGGSQARFLLAKLNPSSTHATSGSGGVGSYESAIAGGGGDGGGGSEIILTDDISMSVFMAHLAKLAVQS